MGKGFPIIVIAGAVIGFLSSAYLFSESDISIENPIKIQNDNSVIQEIEACIEQNLAGDSSVALNSFNTNILLTLKEAASEAQSDKELKEISERLHRLTACDTRNQKLSP